MRIKKYVVNSLPEAMERIKTDLGQEAIILNTKKIKTKGFFGLFGKQQIEVIAALDTQKKGKVTNQPVAQSLKSLGQINSLGQKKGASSASSPRKEAIVKDNVAKETLSKEEVATELKQIRNYLYHLLTEKENDVSPSLKHATQCLKKHGLLHEVSAELMSKIMLRNGFEEKNDKEIIQWLREEIIQFIKKNTSPVTHTFSKVTCFIGPTGVGKTTTIAKLAASLLLKDRKKVGFITSDTYRIAAVEQLKTYAGILGIPLEVVYNPADLEAALDRLNSCDVILMDTAGRNYLEKQFVEELEQLLGGATNVQTNLVISLTSKYEDVRSMLAGFTGINIHSVLFTKLDETRSYGHILNLIYEYGFPISYITNGQEVPDDILRASPTLIADLIVGEEAHA